MEENPNKKSAEGATFIEAFHQAFKRGEKMLHSKIPVQRAFAIRSLVMKGLLEGAKPADLTEDLLQDASATVRATAIEGLSQFHPGLSLGVLAKLMSSGEPQEVRESAAKALFNKQSEDGFEYLMAFVEDSSPKIRIVALGSALIKECNIDMKNEIKLKLLEYHTTSNSSLNLLALEAISKGDPEQGARLLLAALNDPDPHVQASVAATIASSQTYRQHIGAIIEHENSAVRVAALVACRAEAACWVNKMVDFADDVDSTIASEATKFLDLLFIRLSERASPP
jgi:HEAT repeat protein